MGIPQITFNLLLLFGAFCNNNTSRVSFTF